jgi:hypothetical protein
MDKRRQRGIAAAKDPATWEPGFLDDLDLDVGCKARESLSLGLRV